MSADMTPHVGHHTRSRAGKSTQPADPRVFLLAIKFPADGLRRAALRALTRGNVGLSGLLTAAATRAERKGGPA